MIYPYQCSCGKEFEVVKSLDDIDRVEPCPKCLAEAKRVIAGGYFYGEKVEDAVWDPAFGCVVKDSNHRKRLAKERGWEEVGNTDMNKWHADKQAEKQKETERYYDDVTTDRIVLGES